MRDESSSDCESEAGLDPVAAAVCLNSVPGIGPRIFNSLLECFGSPAAALSASVGELVCVPGVGRQLAAQIQAATQEPFWRQEIADCREHHIHLLTRNNPAYPQLLDRIPDPPNVLYARGDFTPQDELAIAIVGTRHASAYGLRIAERLGRVLADAGYTIVSGLARGIDAAAHRGALKAGGRTIAVLGSGLLDIYPAEHKTLAREIVASGCVCSELSLRHPPRGSGFPQRNRIISGLSLGLVVVEAADRSGALISARQAAEQNREVFAVPGSIDSRMSRGCHQLIREGAKLVGSVEDIVEELGPLARPVKNEAGETVKHPAELQLNPQERQVLEAVNDEPTELDSVVQSTGLPVHRVLATISVLEMKKLIRRHSQTSVSRR